MTSKQPKPDMEAALKTLWGASAWPFAAAVKDAHENHVAGADGGMVRVG